MRVLNILKFPLGTAFNCHSNRSFRFGAFAHSFGGRAMLIFKLNSLLSQEEFYGELWVKNHEIFMGKNLK
jgi:hypothetical protein